MLGSLPRLESNEYPSNPSSSKSLVYPYRGFAVVVGMLAGNNPI